MEDLEVSSRLEFHGVAYVATVSVAQQQLHVQVEVDDQLPPTTAEQATASLSHPPSPRPAAAHEWMCWTSSFPSAYIEELTRKTGNFKRFPIFVNMLLSAISQRSDAVFIDLLTTSDLELYRKRKMCKPSFPQKANDAFDSFPSASTPSTANKRYLILTYAVEFDRVHYPLPLSFVQTPTPEILQRTIRRLRQALAAVQGDSKTQQLHEELESLKEENRCLKNTLKQQFGAPTENVNYSNHQQIDRSDSPIDLQRELKATLKENKELIGIYQQLREESSSEISKLKAEIRQLQLAQTSNRNSSSETGGDAIRMLQKQMEQERSEARRKMTDSSNMVQETLEQLQLMKAQFDETQLKNRELMRQLAIARAKANGMNQTAGSSASTRTLQAARAGRATMTSSNGPQSTSNGPSRTTMRQRNALPIRFRQRHPYGDSDEEEDGHTTDGDGAATRRQQPQRPFRRFDPTAYQQEKQRKLRMRRSQSPHNSAGVTNGRPRRGSNGGYTSDSSAGGGGYSSAGSNDSNQTGRRGRPRTRASAEHQRAVADRLASPKRVQDPDAFTNSTPRFRAPLSRPAARPNSRGKSPSPAATTNSTTQRRSNSARGAVASQAPNLLPPPHPRFGQQQQQQRQPPPPPPPQAQIKRPSVAAKKKTLQQRAAAGKASAVSALLADTTADSFSDIDDRLNALQKFLKEAKHGDSGATIATRQAQVQA